MVSHSLTIGPDQVAGRFAPSQPFWLHKFSLQYSSVLIAVGLITIAVPCNETFVFSMVAGSVIAALAFLNIFVFGAPARFSWCLAVVLLLAYAAGSLNSWLTIQRGDMTLAQFFQRSDENVARALGWTLLACAVLFVIGALWERPIFENLLPLRIGPFERRVLFLGTAILLLGYLTGSVGYMGATIDDSNHVSVVGTLIMWELAPLFAFTVCALIQSKSTLDRLWMAGLMGLQLILLVPVSRRVFLFTVLIGILGSQMGEKKLKITRTRLVVGGLVLGCILFLAALVFLYFRAATYGNKRAMRFNEHVQAVVLTFERTSPFEIIHRLQTNVQTRTFFIGYLSDIVKVSSEQTPAFGEDLLNGLNTAIPRVTGLKGQVRQEESVAAQRYGLPDFDQANSVLTAGGIDFGPIGLCLYPVLIVLLLRIVVYLFARFSSRTITLIVVLAMMGTVMEPELGISAYFVTIRNSMLFALFIAVAQRIPFFRLSKA